MTNTKKNELVQQLDRIKAISTKEEWLVFVFAYYERLTLKEIAEVLSIDYLRVNNLLDSVLQKAVPILGTNVELLKG